MFLFGTRYKKAEERGPLIEPMKVFLPVILQMFQKLMSDPSPESALLQKQLIKITYAFIQVSCCNVWKFSIGTQFFKLS